MLAVTLIFFIAAQDIEEDPFGVGMQPYVFPKVICWLMGAMSVLMLVTAGLKLRREGIHLGSFQELQLFAVWVLPMAAIAFIYLGLMNLLQYLVPTILALSACLAIFGNRGVKWLVTIPVISSVFYYVIFFGVFRLLEPTGMLLEYDNYYIFGSMRKFLGV